MSTAMFAGVKSPGIQMISIRRIQQSKDRYGYARNATNSLRMSIIGNCAGKTRSAIFRDNIARETTGIRQYRSPYSFRASAVHLEMKPVFASV